jgi:D-xylose 1-dehydrogenase (NADP+, D-xylono-1,5-lactone-forming)
MARGGRVHATYEALLADPDIEAVYIPLVNSLHREWTLKALEAGKHVLCEKPLAMNAAEAEEMAAAARASGRLLMEAFMYRFHPYLRAEVERLHRALPQSRRIVFSFRMTERRNYRAVAALGGGALYDVGCYCVSLARWLYGEPGTVEIVEARLRGGVDRHVEARLGFAGGRRADILASFDEDERQLLEGYDRPPFTDWPEPYDPYRLMIEAFSAAALAGERVAPLPLEESIANLRVLDRLRSLLGVHAR